MQEIAEDIKNDKLPDIRKNNKHPIKRILKDKSNCISTIKKFFNEDEEKVKNLNFFDPTLFSIENKDVIRSTNYELFSLQTTAIVNAKKVSKKNKENQSDKNKEDSGNLLIHFIYITLIYFRRRKKKRKK
jgi:hypothetical protein